MSRMQPDWEEGKRQMQGQLEELWRELEAFAREGTAVHEVERHLFRKVLGLGFAMLGYLAWFKNSLFWVTQAQRIHPSKLEGEMGSS